MRGGCAPSLPGANALTSPAWVPKKTAPSEARRASAHRPPLFSTSLPLAAAPGANVQSSASPSLPSKDPRDAYEAQRRRRSRRSCSSLVHFTAFELVLALALYAGDARVCIPSISLDWLELETVWGRDVAEWRETQRELQPRVFWWMQFVQRRSPLASALDTGVRGRHAAPARLRSHSSHRSTPRGVAHARQPCDENFRNAQMNGPRPSGELG